MNCFKCNTPKGEIGGAPPMDGDAAAPMDGGMQEAGAY